MSRIKVLFIGLCLLLTAQLASATEFAAAVDAAQETAPELFQPASDSPDEVTPQTHVMAIRLGADGKRETVCVTHAPALEKFLQARHRDIDPTTPVEK